RSPVSGSGGDGAGSSPPSAVFMGWSLTRVFLSVRLPVKAARLPGAASRVVHETPEESFWYFGVSRFRGFAGVMSTSIGISRQDAIARRLNYHPGANFRPPTLPVIAIYPDTGDLSGIVG